MTNNVHVLFVIPNEFHDETECTEIMHSAFQACKANSMKADWIKDCTKLTESEMQKTDFVVFNKFEGELFEKIKRTKATIVGAQCLYVCLLEGLSIPNYSLPVYNVAMYKCVVSASHLSKSTREVLRDKISLMGGKYTEKLFDTGTHLVTDSVKTEKYLKAAELGLKLMLPSWVDGVWEISQTRNIHCDDEEFAKYRCPPLYNLTISTTGFTLLEEREKLRREVEKNGGNYSGPLHVNTTDVLICKGLPTSEKYKMARKSNKIKCVSYDWLADSIKKGYALKEDNYIVQKKPTSTPTKHTLETPDPNFSTMSAIFSFNSTPQCSVLQETVNLDTISNMPRKRKSSSLNDVNDLIESIDIKSVKQAGNFLDGCCVFIAGFTLDQREKISRILNMGGATRYEELSDRITHVIIGDPTLKDVRALEREQSVPIVNLEWLCECIRTEKVVEEEDYIVNLQIGRSSKGTDSPISKKGLKLLRSELSKEILNPPIDKNDNGTSANSNKDVDEDILQQYLKNNLTSQEDTLEQILQNNPFNSKQIDPQANDNHSQVSSNKVLINANPTSESTNISITDTEDDLTNQQNFFHNIKILTLFFNQEQMSMITDCVQSYGGEAISTDFNSPDDFALHTKDPIDFIVVPAFDLPSEEIYNQIVKVATTKNAEIVSEFFVSDCHQCLDLIQIDYYHKPMFLKYENEGEDKSGPLEGKVVTISSYTGTERQFLGDLADRLGAIYQEELCKVNKSNLLASTHLVIPDPVGKKYEAALKWELPVVTKDWLLECAKTGKLEWEGNYLIGDAKAPTPKPKPIETFVSMPKEPSDISFSSTKENVDVNSQPENLSDCSTGHKKQLTPKKNFPTVNETGVTPLKSVKNVNQDSPQFTSQITPVKDIMMRFKLGNKLDLSSPSTPPLSKQYNEVDTPETPYGAFLRPNPSPHLRKECLQWINSLPYSKPRRLSTPFSELKRRLWNKILHKDDEACKITQPNFERTEDDTEYHGDGDDHVFCKDDGDLKIGGNDSDTRNVTPKNALIKSNLQKLQKILSSGSKNQSGFSRRKSNLNQEPCSEATKELESSQACTVGWDYSQPDEKETLNVPHSTANKHQEYIFMLSSIELKTKMTIVDQIKALGGKVSDFQHYDSEANFLLVPKPQRTEKMLSCMAAGKWILHPSYIQKSMEAKQFLDMEAFEYGNPLIKKDLLVNFENDKNLEVEALHYWRVEVGKRGYGAFHDMRAIIVASKRESFVRILEAGGGMVIDASPPFEEDIYATHCLIDPKVTIDLKPYIPLAKQGIFCVNITFVSDFLYRKIRDIRDALLPELATYYQE